MIAHKFSFILTTLSCAWLMTDRAQMYLFFFYFGGIECSCRTFELSAVYRGVLMQQNQNRWKCSDLLTRGMCKAVYKVFDIMKDCNFMNLYIHQIFSLCHASRDNLGCDTNLDSYLINKDARSWGLNRARVN